MRAPTASDAIAPRAVAAYLRVSSRAQDHASQRSAIERAAAARGDTIVRWYSEKRSGKLLARPVLDALRADVRSGFYGRVYAFKLDRFTRSGVGDTYKLVDEFRGRGCEIVAVADNLHLKPGADDIQSDVFLFALGLAARLERQAIAERIAAARDRLEAEGRPWGRPPRLFGPRLERARELRAAGQSLRAISATLKIPRATLARALVSRNPVPESSTSERGSTGTEPGADTLCTSGTDNGGGQ